MVNRTQQCKEPKEKVPTDFIPLAQNAKQKQRNKTQNPSGSSQISVKTTLF